MVETKILAGGKNRLSDYYIRYQEAKWYSGLRCGRENLHLTFWVGTTTVFMVLKILQHLMTDSGLWRKIIIFAFPNRNWSWQQEQCLMKRHGNIKEGGETMGKRKLSRAARFERMFRVWEYLKNNTDREHPTTQAEMRKSPEVSEYIGDKETFNRLIKDMARTMNSDEYGYKPENDWKIYFHDFKKYYGDDAEDYASEADFGSDEAFDESADLMMHIDGLYYNRTFSYDEINSIIEGILATKTLDTKSAANLIEKVERNLTTKFYKKGPKQICKVMEPELTDREQLRTNLLTIQQAIDNNVQVSFRFNGYTYQKKLEPVRDRKDTVSPYYIAASGGRYYLLACKEVLIKGKAVRNMSIWTNRNNFVV